MRLVVDTNVLVAAVRSRSGASNPLVVAGLRDDFRWCCSVPLFYEYEDVLNRAQFLLDTGVSRPEIARFLNAIARAVEPVEVHFRYRPILADPADEMVMEAALNAKAAIVTHNRRDFAAGPARFGIEVLAPSEALERIRS